MASACLTNTDECGLSFRGAQWQGEEKDRAKPRALLAGVISQENSVVGFDCSNKCTCFSMPYFLC